MNQSIKIFFSVLITFVASFLFFQNIDFFKEDVKEIKSDPLSSERELSNSSKIASSLEIFEPGKVWFGDINGNGKENILIATPLYDGSYYYYLFEPGTIGYSFSDFNLKLSEEVSRKLAQNNMGDLLNWQVDGLLSYDVNGFSGLSLLVYDMNNPQGTKRHIDLPSWW